RHLGRVNDRRRVVLIENGRPADGSAGRQRKAIKHRCVSIVLRPTKVCRTMGRDGLPDPPTVTAVPRRRGKAMDEDSWDGDKLNLIRRAVVPVDSIVGLVETGS